MLKCKFVVWYMENGKLEYIEYDEEDYNRIREVFNEDEIIKIETVLI